MNLKSIFLSIYFLITFKSLIKKNPQELQSEASYPLKREENFDLDVSMPKLYEFCQG